MAANPGAWRTQDGVVLAKNKAEFDEPHPQWRWRIRAPPEWKDLSVRVAWREATPVDPDVAKRAADGGVARYHEPSGMVLVARWGVLRTILEEHRLSDELRSRLG